MSSIELTPAEQRVYDKVLHGDIMCKDLSPTESGAVPNLINKGLIEVYKINASTSKVKIIKYLRIRS